MPEAAAEHVRNALQLLEALESALRGLGLLLTAEQLVEVYGPLAAARGRLWAALAELER